MTDLLLMEPPYPDYVNYSLSSRLPGSIGTEHEFGGGHGGVGATLFPFWNASFINGSGDDAFHNRSHPNST